VKAISFRMACMPAPMTLSYTIPLDIVLTNVTLEWVTNSIASSTRFCVESARSPLAFQKGERVPIRCGIAHFP